MPGLRAQRADGDAVESAWEVAVGQGGCGWVQCGGRQGGPAWPCEPRAGTVPPVSLPSCRVLDGKWLSFYEKKNPEFTALA